MRVLNQLTMLLCVFIVCFTTQGAFALCATKGELEAFDFRVFQTKMMVAALSCNHISAYQKLMHKHKEVFSSQGDIIKEYFQNNYPNFESVLNRFITNIANKASQHSMQQFPEKFCKKNVSFLKAIINWSDEKLFDYVEQEDYSTIHNIRACLNP